MLLWGCCGLLAGLIAFGVVAQNPAVTRLIMARVLGCATPTQAGAASGLLNTVQQASGAVGVTCVGLAYEAGGLDGGLWLLGSSIVGTAVLLVGWRSTAR